MKPIAARDGHVTVDGRSLQEFVDIEKANEIEEVRRLEIAENSRRGTVTTSATLGKRRTRPDLTREKQIVMDLIASKGSNWTSYSELRGHPELSGLKPGVIESIVYRLGQGVRFEKQTRGYQGKDGHFLRVQPDQTGPKHRPMARAETPVPEAPKRIPVQANSLRGEIFGFAVAMLKIEKRKAKYMEALAKEYPSVPTFRILARLERGHASLWDHLMERLTLAAESNGR